MPPRRKLPSPSDLDDVIPQCAAVSSLAESCPAAPQLPLSPCCLRGKPVFCSGRFVRSTDIALRAWHTEPQGPVLYICATGYRLPLAVDREGDSGGQVGRVSPWSECRTWRLTQRSWPAIPSPSTSASAAGSVRALDAGPTGRTPTRPWARACVSLGGEARWTSSRGGTRTAMCTSRPCRCYGCWCWWRRWW